MDTFAAEQIADFAALMVGDIDEQIKHLDGVGVCRLGTLFQLVPVGERWKPSPSGFSTRPDALISWLSTQGRSLYSWVGNSVVLRDGCRRMNHLVLRELKTDDPVIVTDERFATGRAVMRGDHDAALDSSLLNNPDRRRAHQVDVHHICNAVIHPAIVPSIRR